MFAAVWVEGAMNFFRKSVLLPVMFAALVMFLSDRAQAQQSSPVATTTALGNSITVPSVYESTVSTISALATGATAALKNNRSEQRSLTIRKALATALMAGGLNKPIDLRKDQSI